MTAFSHFHYIIKHHSIIYTTLLYTSVGVALAVRGLESTDVLCDKYNMMTTSVVLASFPGYCK